ncbi:Bifunctional (p)ppGpp synthase/hydrolase SpoT [Thiorhodovibrio winogradskyi]|uniref:guanosine-3',5'-bis(diphosphate) 3'-diphosphatase n=1 Tax=Thiorhodovibrio winogradskyi TaxID=77007 RepID=A0ABZ0S7F8_9GAMM|nr:bifunctional (p)ppGpp synthetase/guanosine-3',5'-bis(diphosphate) 3'-pyrophosphohydrolase [Thiorhodovibrio winogradskyi]
MSDTALAPPARGVADPAVAGEQAVTNPDPDVLATAVTASTPVSQPIPPKKVTGTNAAPRFLISDLCKQLESYLPREQISEIYRAYLFGAEAHEGQARTSGEPYIFHPIAVARILADLRMDHKCLMAAILHDVVEDTPTAKEQIAEVFDDEIAELVDGVSKLTQIKFKTDAEKEAANFSKMMLAMTRDIRVILIKLADRLHNMRTMGVMPPEKRRRKSRETLDIYAPIANRLGINSIRLALEDFGFSHLWPWRHFVLDNAVRKVRCGHHEMIASVESAIRRRLEQQGIAAEVTGREKHLYSIYCKMRDEGKSFHDLVDVFAFRVIVDSIDTCYRVLGQVHNLYKPVPGRFKDYIAIPKSNGYQSIHTVLFGPQGVKIEIQIRSTDMHRVAESGIASHWLYKTGGEHGKTPALASDWLQNLLELQRDSGDPREFLEHVKIDLFPDDVYVFTPSGEIKVLPRGATAIDFAYAIHSDIGNTGVYAVIDRRPVPINSILRSGQTVEISTIPSATPKTHWLKFVVTGKARANIRGFLKNMQQREAARLGRDLVNNELNNLGLSLDDISVEQIAAYAQQTDASSADAMFADIGLGNRMPMLVARRLASAEGAEQPEPSTVAPSLSASKQQLAILGTEGMVMTFPRCCRPIPGDQIAGLFNPGKGIVVHRLECRNLGDYQSKRGHWVDLQWAEAPSGDFITEIRLEVEDQRGALASIATAIAEAGSDIANIQSRDKAGGASTLDFQIKVQSRRHLARILRRLRQIPLVLRITRLCR